MDEVNRILLFLLFSLLTYIVQNIIHTSYEAGILVR